MAQDTGFFKVAKQNQDIEFITVGHDHNNDFQGDLDGIKLIYGRKTGYGSYGPPLKWGWKARGARVFSLKLNSTTSSWTWDTYIREESGKIILGKDMPLNKPGSHKKYTKCNGAP
eukprot:Nk52_evm38s232 gene=Nk52_evmTU38s232